MDDDITIRDVVHRDYVGVSEADTLREVAEIMLQDDVSGVVVLRGSDIAGVATDRDILHHSIVQERAPSTPIGEIMRETGPTVEASVPVEEAFSTLTADDVDHLLVMHEGDIVGMVSARDLVLASASLLSDWIDRPEMAGPTEFDIRDSDEMDEYSTQSVCEVCGSFSPELHNINGQLLCDDCRSV